MCHQSVGLVANAIEGFDISTVVISVKPDVTQGTGAPRAVNFRFPMGNPVGEPDKPDQQRRLLQSTLEVLEQLQEPGHLVRLPYSWRRMKV